MKINDTVQEMYKIVEFKTKDGINCADSFFTEQLNWLGKVSTEILAPTVCVREVNGEYYFEFITKKETTEIALIVIIAVTFVMSLLIFIGWRSTHPYFSDWFRFIALYGAATLLFVFVLQLAPVTPGFSRFVGFAVVIHNFAELYLLRRIWYGKDSGSFLGIAFLVLYVFLMTTFLAFLPMNALYLVALIQGAIMDYLFCTTLPMIAHKFKSISEWNYHDWILASIGAFIHVISIQPLFFGFSLGNGGITGVTTLGLFPTFFFYTYFAGRELGRLGFVGPSYAQHLDFNWRVAMLQRSRDNPSEVPLETVPSTTIEDRARVIYHRPNVSRRETSDSGVTRSLTNAAREEIMNIVTDDTFGASEESIRHAKKFAEKGAIKFFKMSNKEIAFPFILAFVLALFNSVLVWFSPCYLETKCSN